MSIRVAAYTSGVNIPSSRFRVRQLIPALQRLDVKVKEYISPIEKYTQTYPPGFYYKVAARTGGDPMKLWLKARSLKRTPEFLRASFSDITWLERVLVPEHLTDELRLKKPLVLDLDDAIWLPGTEGYGFLDKIVSRSDMIFAGNDYIANWCNQFNNNIAIIPTSVDTDRFVPSQNPEQAKIRIGWIGTSSNFTSLQMVLPAIRELMTKYEDVEFHYCSDREGDFGLPRTCYKKWSAESEVSFLQGIHIGIMPLEDTEWNRGKCSFKLLQYMAVGIPAVASPVGMNHDVLNKWNSSLAADSSDQWIQVLEQLIISRSNRNTIGEAGRKIILEEYSVQVVAGKIAGHFKTLI